VRLSSWLVSRYRTEPKSGSPRSSTKPRRAESGCSARSHLQRGLLGDSVLSKKPNPSGRTRRRASLSSLSRHLRWGSRCRLGSGAFKRRAKGAEVGKRPDTVTAISLHIWGENGAHRRWGEGMACTVGVLGAWVKPVQPYGVRGTLRWSVGEGLIWKGDIYCCVILHCAIYWFCIWFLLDLIYYVIVLD
jgi:hypothetical protein